MIPKEKNEANSQVGSFFNHYKIENYLVIVQLTCYNYQK